MNACIVYFSRTGNTKRLAQAIAEITKANLYDLESAPQSAISNCDLLILGTPVEGASPAKETVAFIEKLPQAEGKKVILFCTYKIFGNERTLKAMEKLLSAKGYRILLRVSKKGMQPGKETDFSKVTEEVKQALSENT